MIKPKLLISKKQLIVKPKAVPQMPPINYGRAIIAKAAKNSLGKNFSV